VPGMLLLLLLGGYLWWRSAQPSVKPAGPVQADKTVPAAKPAAPVAKAGQSGTLLPFPLLSGLKSSTASNAVLAARAAQFHYRLNNTSKSIDQLARSDHALLLENALIDTSGKPLAIPASLQSEDPGSYIVQARGPVDGVFRAMLAAAGATIVSYIPNNAYLVTASQSAAQQIAAYPETQDVQPYEPYFKLKGELLRYAVEQPAGALFMVRRAVWQELGGFDESFWPLWFEDVDFCRRMADAGHVSYYVPEAVAKHTGGHSIPRLSVQMRHFYWYRSLLHYSAKHFRALPFRAVCAAVVAGSIVRAVAESLGGRGWKAFGDYGRVASLASRIFLFGWRG